MLSTASPLVFVTPHWHLPAIYWTRFSRAGILRLSLIFLKYPDFTQPASFATLATRAQSPHQRSPVGMLATGSPLVFVTPLLYLPAMHWARLARAGILRLSLIFLKYLHFASPGLYETLETRVQSPHQRTPVGELATASPLVFVTPLLYMQAMHWAWVATAESLRLSLIFLKYLHFASAGLICKRGN